MSPRVERSLPPYLQITQHYRDLIQNGELRDGDRIPSARQLVEQWGVAHATAAKVLATLRAEGLVTTTSGGAGGTMVHVQEVGQTPRDRILAVRRGGRIYPPGEHARITLAEMTHASEDVADALRVPVGAKVIRRRRVTYQGETPVSASTSWFDGDLASVAPNLLITERIRLGTPGYIGQQTGRIVQLGRDQVTAGSVGDDLAEALDIPVGSPVLIGRNWYLDADGDVIEYGEFTSRPGRWLTYEYDVG